MDLLKKNTKQTKALLVDVDRAISVMETAKGKQLQEDWLAVEEGVLVLLRCFKHVLTARV